MALPYTKPQGFRFQNGGLSLRNTPDALQPNKYASLVNVRDYADLAISTRPGYTLLFNGNSIPVTDIRAYAALGTDDSPRFLARTQNNQIVLDTGVQITPLGGAAGSGISMNAFRPNGSTQSWMYCAAQADYKKIPAPTVGVPFAVKVGIAEPQVAVEYVQATPTFFNNATGVAASWTAGGTAGAPANADVLGGTGNSIGGAGGPDGTNWGVASDPQNFNRFSIGVTTGNFYLPNDIVTIGGTSNLYLVDAVLQTINQTTISNIRYDSGAGSGQCSIVLSFDYSNILARGSLLVLDNGTNKDLIFVQSVLSGSGNSTCVIRTSTLHTFAPGNLVFGEQTLVVYPIGGAPVPPSGTITVPVINTAITPGTGTLTQSFTGNNFAKFGLSDYIHLSFQTSSISSITNISILFDTTDQSFTKSFFTYSLSSTALLQVLGDGLTEINIPLSVLTNQSANFGEFANVTALRISVTVSANTTFGIQAFWIGGGNGPDVGYVNSSTSNALPGYKYLVKPRNAASSGVVGNPCPDQRYALFVHRQSIVVKTSLLSSSYDPQIDTWDIYRAGGTITSYQYVGSVAVGQDFTDTLTDAGASTGIPLATDDFEPWPTIGTPVANFTNISLVGTFLTGTANTVPSPNFLTNILPGTLLTLPPLGTFTLRSRPTNVGVVYTFELEQNAGPSAPTSIVIQEPTVANQHLQSVSGPDSNGFFFAVGDTFRPGVVYYSKAFQPDSAPEANTAELSPPNEPLIGSLIVNGLAYVYSTRRWWAAYPNPFATVAPFFTFVEQAIGETPLSPFGSTTDGSRIYFWGRKGIYVTDGTAAKSITDQDLLQLFPHEGILGTSITVSGQVYSAPDFTQIAKFRLSIVGNYLYADYTDVTAAQHTLVYNTKSQAWVSYDIYNIPMFTHYAPLQQVGQLQGGGTGYSDYCVMGGADGNVYLQGGTIGDNGVGIPCTVQTFEWDGGDPRALVYFGDLYLDLLPRSTVKVTAMQFGASTGIIDTVAASTVRTQIPLSLNGQQLQKFLGISLSWTDTTPSTTLYLWQASTFTQPEFTIDRVSDFWDLGSAALVRGVILTADTFGGPKVLNFTDDSSNSHFITANHIGQQEIAYAFVPPFVAHELRIRPQGTGPWRFFGLKWILDPWPELIPLYSEWLTVGPGAMYLRAATIPMDTNGLPVSLTFVGSDGTSTTLGPFTTPAAEKTEVPMAFVPPLVAHEVQIVPSAPVRLWTKEIMWVADPYTELIPAYTAIMLMNSTDNAYVMGLKLTADSGGVAVGFNVLKDGGVVAATIPAQVWSGKETIPIVFPTPFLAHNWQLQPTGSIRIFAGESKWVFQATPESMVQWGPTQATSHGQDGFHFLYSLQAAYISTAPITLTITSVDGTSPAALVLPSSGGVASKPTLFFTFNKGKLFIYKATSANPFQLFLQEWSLKVGNWGAPDLVTINNLGGMFGDKAEI